MKRKFNYLCFILASTINLIYAQTNDLTIEEFLNIEIEDVKLSKIKAAKGNENSMQSFFENLNIEKGDEPSYWISFSSNLISFLFQDGILVDNRRVYQLTNISITDISICLKIKNIELRIGDPLSILGEVAILTYNDGVKEVVYKLGSQVIEIGFDPEAEIITSIKYRYYNT